MENILSEKINECLMNDKFAELPISTIYRIVKRRKSKGIQSDKLFDFIKKSISKFFVLFQFLELQDLSENRIEELFEIYSNSDESNRKYFNYVMFNVNIINQMNDIKKNLQKNNQEKQEQIDDLLSQIDQLKNEKNELQKRLKVESFSIKGKIISKVKNGLLISARIDLSNLNGYSLDTTKR